MIIKFNISVCVMHIVMDSIAPLSWTSGGP